MYPITDGYELPNHGRQSIYPNGSLVIENAHKLHDEGFYTEMWSTIATGNVWRGRFINKKKDGKSVRVWVCVCERERERRSEIKRERGRSLGVKRL